MSQGIIFYETRAPTTTDYDNNDDFGNIPHIWINTTTMEYYIRTDGTPNAVVWSQITPYTTVQTGTLAVDDGVNTDVGLDYSATIIGHAVTLHVTDVVKTVNTGMVNISNVNPPLPSVMPTQAKISSGGMLSFCYRCD